MESRIVVGEEGVARCWWGVSPPVYVGYHDDEWGMPVDDDRRLFEKLCLEGFQAGLSWLTILRKRPAFRAAFHDFDAGRVAAMGGEDVDRLLEDASIVRHRGKIESTINNARCVLDIVAQHGSLAAFLWRYEPQQHPTVPELVAETAESRRLAKDLKARGFRFVGPTTVYAFMQAMGLVNDHLPGCDARERCAAARAAFKRPGW